MDCNYPDCLNCQLDDCVMEQQDIHNLLKRRRWAANPEFYREKQQAYRNQQENVFHTVMNAKNAFWCGKSETMICKDYALLK